MAGGAAEGGGGGPVAIPFPYTPYNVQQQFMQAMYQTLDKGRIGVFESPTGTGKSLSILCSSLQWLRDHKIEGESPATAPDAAELPSWITNFQRTKSQQSVERQLSNLQERLDKSRKRASSGSSNENLDHSHRHKKIKPHQGGEELDESGDDSDCVIEDYCSDGGTAPLASPISSDDDEDEEELVHARKIFFCTRTHSQIAQFVREAKKTDFCKDLRVTSLGSRQKMCINDKVSRLQSAALVNAACLDLQKDKSKGARCPFQASKKVSFLGDSVLASVRDVEEIVSAAKQVQACSYYGARSAVPLAELVALPYTSLLHKATRESLGLRLKGNVVVIDEAHNLVDALTSMHSVDLSLSQISVMHSELQRYQERYRSRLNPANFSRISQLLHMLRALLNVLNRPSNLVRGKSDGSDGGGGGKRVWSVNDFIFEMDMAELNLFRLHRYLETSGLVTKIQAVYERTCVQQQSCEKDASHTQKSTLRRRGSNPHSASQAQPSLSVAPVAVEAAGGAVSVLAPLVQFLAVLTNDDKDGRVVLTWEGKLPHYDLSAAPL